MRIHAAHSLALAACVLLAGMPGGHLQAHDPDAEALRKLNRQILEGLILRQDASTFLAHAHENFVVVAPGGRVEDKAQSAAGASSFDATGVTISGEQATVVDDTAVLVGKLEIDGVMRPVGKLGPMKFMAVFVRQDGEWKLLSRALTPCFEMAIERGFC